MKQLEEGTIRVLMAEDNEVDYLAFLRYQDNKLLNFETTCVASVADCQEALSKQHFDVVVIDYLLEDGTGLEIIPMLDNTPFVFVTGASDLEVAIQAMKEGAYDYIVKDYNGKYLRILAKIIRAAAKQKAAQMALQASEEQLNLLHQAMTHVDNAVLIVNTKGEIQWVNEFFTKLTGYSKRELIESNGEVLHPYSSMGFHNLSPHFQNVMRTKRSTQFESKIFTKSGHVLYTLSTLSPVLDEANEIQNIVSVDIDISKRKDFEKELVNAKIDAETAVKAKDLFLANISHEIRTPLNAIMGASQLLKDRIPEEKDQTYLRIVRESSEHLLEIINEVLDFTKLQEGKFNIVQQPFSLQSLLKSVQDSAELRSREAQLKFQAIQADEIPDHCIGDQVRIKQILNNLLSNSFKFTRKGWVSLKVNSKPLKNDYVELAFEIEDTGIGIPSDKLQKVFEKFTQLQYEYNKKFEGTGLGLSISKRLAEMMGGSISISSELKKGTIARFTLPVKISRQKIHVEREEKVLPQNIMDALSGIEVLLVEDNVMNQIVGQKFLQQMGAISEVASSGAEAIQKMHDKQYDLILMDLQMPEMDGFATTKSIRSSLPKPYCDTPIIAMTAHAIKGVEDECKQHGMNDYISKPINYNNLMDKLYAVYLKANPQS